MSAGIVQNSYKVGSQGLFFREGVTFTVDHLGATVSATPATKYAKPGAAQLTGWENLGVIEVADDKVTVSDPTKVMGPTPGKFRVVNVIGGAAERVIALTLVEPGPAALQANYMSSALTTGSGTIDVMAKDILKGWLKLQSYDEKDHGWLHHDVFVALVPTGSVKKDGKEIVKLTFDAIVIHSPLNQTSTDMV